MNLDGSRQGRALQVHVCIHTVYTRALSCLVRVVVQEGKARTKGKNGRGGGAPIEIPSSEISSFFCRRHQGTGDKVTWQIDLA